MSEQKVKNNKSDYILRSEIGAQKPARQQTNTNLLRGEFVVEDDGYFVWNKATKEKNIT
jgi:hypothetical protein